MASASLFQVGKDVEYWRVLVHLNILAFCLVIAERVLHRLELKFPPSTKYQHMLKKAYRELMVLGLLSLGLKVIKEMADIDSNSKTVLAFQVADLTIFLLALALILQSTGVFLLLRNQNYRAERAELISTRDLVHLVDKLNGLGDTGSSVYERVLCCSLIAKTKAHARELVELRLLRRLFLHRFGLPQLFPFSKYLRQAQANQIEHMIEVGPSMWAALLIVAWSICGLLEAFKSVDTSEPESHELVEAFMTFAWILLLLHVIVFLYFRSCVYHLLYAAAFSNDKAMLLANLKNIAEEEAEAWNNEEAEDALEVMSCIQEHHEELELQRRRRKRAGHHKVKNFTDNRRESFSGVMPGSPPIAIRYFSHKAWHIGTVLLLSLNGFLITLFLQCAFYDMADIYYEFGTLPALMVPLPLMMNAFILQHRIFYDFVIVSNTLRINSHTLSDVVENFSEVVRLRSEFAATLLNHIIQQENTIPNLQEELKARSLSNTGLIEVDDLRDVLAKFGFRLTRFRFNCVIKLLFELQDTTVAYDHVVRLVLMAQTENLLDMTSVPQQKPHPMLRPSVIMYDDLDPCSMWSQSDYHFADSTRNVIPIVQPFQDSRDSTALVTNVGIGSSTFNEPPRQRGFTLRGGTATKLQPTQALGRSGVSARALHDVFNLQRLSDSQDFTKTMREI